MTNPFFEKPILNSPYEYPSRHWELDATGQPTQAIKPSRRPADFITPIPKPRKRKRSASNAEPLTAPHSPDAGAASNTRNYFLLACGVVQIVLFYVLGHFVEHQQEVLQAQQAAPDAMAGGGD